MDFLGFSPAQHTAAATWLLAGAAVATLVVVALTALYARQQIDLARDQLRDQSRPYVVVAIEVEQQSVFMLTVTNIGRTPARNVRIELDQPPRSKFADLEDLALLQMPIPTMPPGQKFRAYWESALEMFNDDKPYPYPLIYKATVTYEGHYGEAFDPEEYVLDFRIFGGQAAGLKGMTELIKAVDKIADEHKRWSQGHGVWVRAIDGELRQRRQERPVHWRQMRRAYEKDGLKAAALYWIKVWRRRFGLWSR